MTLLNFAGQNALRLISNLILTRLLFPEAFGIMALVQVVISGAAMFSDFGFRGAVVQDPRGENPEFLNTVWTLQIVRGALLMALIIAVAGPLSEFYESPQLEGLLLVAAFVPLIQGFYSTRMFSADRTLQLERVTLITLFAQGVGIVVTVALAWLLESVWALVIGNLVNPLCLVVLSHSVLRGHANRLHLDRSSVAGLFRYGGFIFVASAAGFFSNYGDRAVLGKYIELEALAFFQIAMLLAAVPKQLSITIASRVLFPLYARRPPVESVVNKQKIDKARRLVTAPLIISAGAFAVIGDILVQVLYDTRYESAGPYLVLISLSLMPQIVTQSYHRFPLAAGHSGRFAVFQIALAIVRFGLLLLLVPSLGILGAIITVPLGVLIMYPALIYMIRPYNGWDPIHDIVALGASIVVATGVLWLNSEVLKPVLTASIN